MRLAVHHYEGSDVPMCTVGLLWCTEAVVSFWIPLMSNDSYVMNDSRT